MLAKSSETPRLDAEVIFKYISKLSDAQVITQAAQPLDAKTVSGVDSLILKRQQGKPIAYIVGQREFYSLDFKVDEHVLIPRPETELLVDAALEIIAHKTTKTVLDLGTGSGAIALAIAHYAPSICVTAVDKDPKALQIAELNKQQLRLSNIGFMQSDWYTALNHAEQQFDLIVANPPYIASQDTHLALGDVRFEPLQALVSAKNGLSDLAHIISHAPKYLRLKGRLIVEHGYDQAQTVQKMFRAAGFSKVSTQQDLAGNDRISFGET